MAPISPDNTKRYFLDYSTCGFDHTLLCRTESTVTASDAGGTIAAFLDAIDSVFRLITVVGFRVAVVGSNITTSVTWPGAGTYGSGAGSAYESAQYLDFVGRGGTGHRARVAVFGCIFSEVGNNYRLESAENALVAAAIAELTSDTSIFNDIDGQIPVWHTYANTGVNAYWRNKIR